MAAILDSARLDRARLESFLLTFTTVPGVAGFRIKGLLDVVLSVSLILMLAPLLALIAVAIKLTSRGPAVFVQKRIGYRGLVFDMFKFRTMRDGADQIQDRLAAECDDRTFLKIDNDPRITPLGRWLRVTSLDELPQLFNVLRGDMSLVGPRPILVCDFHKFPRGHQLRRFAMRPGMTGLWQINGRSSCSDEERMQFDLVYVDAWSLSLDVMILARTVPAVLTGRGAN